jgi:hypothetical protein
MKLGMCIMLFLEFLAQVSTSSAGGNYLYGLRVYPIASDTATIHSHSSVQTSPYVVSLAQSIPFEAPSYSVPDLAAVGGLSLAPEHYRRGILKPHEGQEV